MAKTETTPEEEPHVNAIITGYTSIRGRMLAPGPTKLRRSEAQMLRDQGLARPPKKGEISEAAAANAEPNEEDEPEDDGDETNEEESGSGE